LRSKELVLERANWVASIAQVQRQPRPLRQLLIERCGHAAECKHPVNFDQNAATGAGMRRLG
jgi:hypothetical protein